MALSTWGLIFLFFFIFYFYFYFLSSTTNESIPRRVYLPDPDPIVMEKWTRDTESEVKEDEDLF